MAQSLYFNDTCDPVDLTDCTQYYVDPCDCTQFYQCAQNQRRMFQLRCRNGAIYSHKTWVCDYPNDAICQTLRPWERCNVTESRMEQLRLMCFNSTSDSSTTGNSTPNSNTTVNSTPNSNNNGNSDLNTNGINVPFTTQTILPAVLGVLVLVIIIGLVIHRYKKFTKKEEIHIPDPIDSHDSFRTPIPEYCPYETLRFNPIFGVAPDLSEEESISTSNPLSMLQPREADRPVPNLNSQEDEIASSGGSTYVSIQGSDTTSMQQPGDADQKFAKKTVSREDSADRPVPDWNSQEDEIASSGGSLYESIRGSDTTAMPQPTDSDYEFANKTASSDDSADIPVPNLNSQEDEIASSGGSSYVSIQGSYTTSIPQPADADQEFANKTASSEDSADRPVPDWNSQEDEIASSGGSSYESIRGSDTTAMPQPSDSDHEFANKTASSEDSADRPVPDLNSQEDEITSSGGGSYESIRGSDTTAMPQPTDSDHEFANKTASSEDSADRPVPNLNSQEDEIASSGGNSYESIRRSDTTAIPQQRDVDEEFDNKTISSADSECVVGQQSYPLFHPYIIGNSPWPHKVIFSTKDHFLPPT